MAFWGVEVTPGKVAPFVPPPEGSKLHLSQASLGGAAPSKSKAVLKVKVADGDPLVVCVLREGGTECLGLDLIFDAYTEFTAEGSAAIHLTGYYMPEYELDDAHDMDEDDGEEDLDDETARRLIGFDENGIPILSGEYDSQDDSDYESESADEGDEELDFDSEEEEDGEGDDDLGQIKSKRKVVIEDITDQDAARPRRGQKLALPAPEAKAAAAGNGKAQQFDDDDVSASDDDEEDDEEEEEEEEEESDEEVEADVAQHAGQKRKGPAAAGATPAPAKKQAAAAGGKPAAAAAGAAARTPGAAAKTPGAATPKEAQQKLAAKQPATNGEKTPAAKTSGKVPKSEAVAGETPPSSSQKVRRYPNGFEVEDVKKGRPDAKLAKAGKKVVVKYVGKLKSNGKIFDQTKGNRTFSFRLGVGEVIKGWDRGVEGMRVGDKRKLSVPPQMAYGTSGIRGAIPPNAWLNFEVELVDVK